MTDVSRAVIFGRDALSYDRFRPEYPPEAIEHLSSIVAQHRVVEVGAGTGKATDAVAREGLELTCLEPSPQMAEVLRQKSLPGVEVVVATFEDWGGGAPASVDLIYAAQAWHWVDQAIAYPKARSLLRPGGALALMWNIPTDRFAHFEDVYSRHAPWLMEAEDERIRRRDSHDWLEDLGAAGFTDLQLFIHPWSTEMTAWEYRSLCSTYSDHMMLEEPARTRLLDALEAKVEVMGGSVEVDYETRLFSGLI